MGTPVNLLLSSQKCQGVPFSPNLSKIITFAAAPLVLTPFVRNQVSHRGFRAQTLGFLPEEGGFQAAAAREIEGAGATQTPGSSRAADSCDPRIGCKEVRSGSSSPKS